MSYGFVKVTLADGDTVVTDFEDRDSLIKGVQDAAFTNNDPRTTDIDAVIPDQDLPFMAEVIQLHKECRDGQWGWASNHGIALLPPELMSPFELMMAQLMISRLQDHDDDILS
jgi:hypothetical protein